MGHTRLGKIPKTQKWGNVVQTVVAVEGTGAQISSAENMGAIATQTLIAAQAALRSSVSNLGLRYTFYMLTQVVLASREPDWQTRLNELGISITPDSTLLEFTSEFQSAIDDYLSVHRHSSDIGEMAQQAAGEALAYLAAPTSVTLFGAGSEEVRLSIRKLSTKQGFSRLGQKFFGIFIARFINFYLSRLTSAQLGNQVLPHVGELTRFNVALLLHCEQSAQIIHDFSGEWYSKTEYLKGINLENTSSFLAIALQKLRAELVIQEADI